MNTVRRNITFVLSYFVCWALYLWFTPIVRSPFCYVADLMLVAAGVVGLVWAGHNGFRGFRWSWLGVIARLSVVVVLFLALTVTVLLYGWRVQPAIGELITPSSSPVTQQQDFYPSLAFSSNAEHNAFIVGWYTNQLAALSEGSFYALASDTNAHAFRFTCLRSFNHAFCVVITFDRNGRAVVTGKMSSGAGGYAPGRLCRRRHTTISPRRSQEFLDLVAAQSFWTLPTSIETFGCDGSEWIIEGVDHGTYHVVDRWTPEESTPVGQIGRAMLYLSGMRVWFLY